MPIRTAKEPFYDTRLWRDKLRPWQLQHQPLCQHCLARGIIELATQVDHIKPISEGGDPRDTDNLQSLCASCHSAKTRADNGGRLSCGCDLSGLPLDARHPWNSPRDAADVADGSDPAARKTI